MASGSPPSLRQSSPTACGGTSAAEKPGSRSLALAMNSWTASEAAISRAPAATEGQSSGGMAQHTSPGTRSTIRLVSTMHRFGAEARNSAASPATSSR